MTPETESVAAPLSDRTKGPPLFMRAQKKRVLRFLPHGQSHAAEDVVLAELVVIRFSYVDAESKREFSQISLKMNCACGKYAIG